MGTPQCRPGGHSPIKPHRPVRRARTGGKTLNKPHNCGHRYAEPARRANPKHDTEPLCAGLVTLLLQTRSGSLVCPTLAAVSLRWQKSVDRGAEAIYVSGHVMADSLYV